MNIDEIIKRVDEVRSILSHPKGAANGAIAIELVSEALDLLDGWRKELEAEQLASLFARDLARRSEGTAVEGSIRIRERGAT